jgi:hypothetical protein
MARHGIRPDHRVCPRFFGTVKTNFTKRRGSTIARGHGEFVSMNEFVRVPAHGSRAETFQQVRLSKRTV